MFHVFTMKRESEIESALYQENKEKWQKLEEKNENKVNNSLIIESSLESSFQFNFQTLYLLPTIILNFKLNGTNDLTDLVNWKLLSILLSFGTFAFTTYKIRNADKKDALTTNSLLVLILKIIFDSVSRILIFGIWMFVLNNGQFSTFYVVVGYYAAVLTLIIFNLVLNWEWELFSSRFWIGIILNSMNSVLSFNNLNLNFILGKKTKDEHLHESSFLKQTLYYLLFFCFKVGFTVSTLLNVSDKMVLVDVNGRKIELIHQDVFWILGTGWIASFLALVLNFVYYNLHPSAVDFNIGRFRKRIVLYICGFRLFKKGEDEDIENH